MTWLTWRQHRQEGFWALVAVVVLAGATVLLTHEMSAVACQGAGNSYCFPDDFAGQVARNLTRLNLVTYGLVVLPALAGAFIAAPLVAREIENGTARLVWTQGVTRARWLTVKVVLVFLPLLAGAAVLGILFVLLINAEGPLASRWDFFDQQAPMVVAGTAFALAAGTAAGTLVGRSIPAMALTLVGVVFTRVGIAELARAHYIAPLLFKTQDPSLVNFGAGPDWYLEQPEYIDAAGRSLGNTLPGFPTPASSPVAVSGPPSNADLMALLHQHGISIVWHYQPADRFWTFQTIESAILTVLAMVLLAFAAYRVMRRAG